MLTRRSRQAGAQELVDREWPGMQPFSNRISSLVGQNPNLEQKGKPDVEMPAEVVEKTKARYTEVFERLTDNSLEDALKKVPN